MVGNRLYANLPDPASGATPDPGKSGSGEAGPVSGAVPAKSQADIELKVIRDICRREGHGRFVEVTSPADHPFRIHWCRRGCGTRVVDAPRGLTVPELWQVMERLGMTAAKVDEASFVLEPDGPNAQDPSIRPVEQPHPYRPVTAPEQGLASGGLVDSSRLHHAGEHLGSCRECTCADACHTDWGCQTTGCDCINHFGATGTGEQP